MKCFFQSFFWVHASSPNNFQVVEAQFVDTHILISKKTNPNKVRDLPAALREATAGTQLEFRAEGENATVNVPLAVNTLNDAQVLENTKYFVGVVRKNKPKTSENAMDGANPKTGVVEGGDSFFLNASVSMQGGMLVHLDTNSIMPSGTGYFR